MVKGESREPGHAIITLYPSREGLISQDAGKESGLVAVR